MTLSLIETAMAQKPLGRIISGQLELVSDIFENHLVSDDEDLNSLCRHLERYRGKMLRPTLVLISGMAATGSDSEESLTDRHRILAAVVEMIHMATLVHDDILDESEVRRGGVTINALSGNDVAVMLGDYLISKSFHLCSTMGDPKINLALGEVTNTLCEGEVIQLHRRNDIDLSEETYLDIVGRKTGSLIGACCRLGGVISGVDDSICRALESFGTNIGTAFQIKDDLLDLIGDTKTIGKTVGRDLDLGKLTLPLIRLRMALSEEDRSLFDEAVRTRDRARLQSLMDRSNPLESTIATANELVGSAKDEIRNLPAGPAVDLMLELADGVITRDA